MRSLGYQNSRQFVKFNSVLETTVKRIQKSMNKPVQSFRDKGVDVAVWETRNGGMSITIRKTYKDKQSGEYKESKYLFKEDAERLIELLKQAVSYAHNRAEHNTEHMASGGFNPNAKPAVMTDDDEIPF
jgi:DNA-binding protein YbaB